MIFLIFIVAVLSYIVYSRTRKTYRAVERMYPGPIDWPFFGNALMFLFKGKIEVFELAIALSKKHIGSFRLKLGPLLYIAVYDPRDVEIVLGTSGPSAKSHIYDLMRPWVGDGLLLSSGEKNRQRRKLIMPAFHFSALEKFCEVFKKNNMILCKLLEKFCDHDDGFDVFPLMKMYSLDNILETALDSPIQAQLNPQSDYVKAIHTEADVVYKRIISIHLRSDWIFEKTRLSSISSKARKIIHGLSENVIKSKRVEFEKKVQETEDYDEFSVKRKKAFIDILLQASNELGLTDFDIRDEVNTIILGGHDTLSSALSFTFYELARHPQIQEKVFQEVQGVLNGEDRDLLFSETRGLRYLEQVLKETLRHYPPLPVIARTASQDVHLTDGKYIPQGGEVAIHVSALHKNPEHWNNPDEYNPDNFSADCSQKRHPYAYVPFSAGPRNCIGQKFAMLEMKFAVSAVVRNFVLLPSLRPEDKIKVQTDLILSSQNGVHIRLKKRVQRSVTTRRVSEGF